MPFRSISAAPISVRRRISWCERHLLEHAFQHGVVRMVMRVDEAGHDQLAAGLDDFDARPRRDVGRNALDLAVVDEQVRDRGLVDVAVVVVDPSAADQKAGLSGCGHSLFSSHGGHHPITGRGFAMRLRAVSGGTCLAL
jgi:hypothetical protein